MPLIQANGTELYHRVQGDGPPVLFIMGASGDAGHFAKVAEQLSDEFAVITYDRRGNGRSPRPANWTTTSPREQADDAAALIKALSPGPVAVFGTSSGATFALCLLINHPSLIRGCILHEPVITRLYDDPSSAKVAAVLAAQTLQEGGPALVMERFWRLVAGDANWDSLDEALRGRMLATAGTFAEVELGTFEDYLPGEDELARIGVPVRLLVSEHGRAPQQQAAGRLAERFGTLVEQVPGTHTPYWDHPLETSQAIREFVLLLDSGVVGVSPAHDSRAVALAAATAGQRQTWSTGDFSMIARQLVPMSELVCETARLRAGQRVLDVATGSGNTALAAARRLCTVTGLDFVPQLLEVARTRAAAERLPVTFDEGDAQALPYPDRSFDVVLSTIGTMFAPDQPQAARELIRVCRPGGRIALANWAPDGFTAELFGLLAKHVPAPPGIPSPLVWGTEQGLRELFGERSLTITPRQHIFRARSTADWIEHYREYFGPVRQTFAALTPPAQQKLTHELEEFLHRYNVSEDSTLVLPAAYVEIVIDLTQS